MRSAMPALRLSRGAVLLASALALVPPAAARAADIEAGRQKAEPCAACHGAAGVSEIETVPSLAGQQARYIVIALYQFRAGNRQSEQMAPVTAEMSDDDFGDLAAYYASLPAWPPHHRNDPEKAAAAQHLAAQDHCVQCHGPAFAGQEHIPRVAGQTADYLRAQLQGFRASTRGDIDGLMTSAAQALSDADIDLLADYIAGLH